VIDLSRWCSENFRLAFILINPDHFFGCSCALSYFSRNFTWSKWSKRTRKIPLYLVISVWKVDRLSIQLVQANWKTIQNRWESEQIYTLLDWYLWLYYQLRDHLARLPKPSRTLIQRPQIYRYLKLVAVSFLRLLDRNHHSEFHLCLASSTLRVFKCPVKAFLRSLAFCIHLPAVLCEHYAVHDGCGCSQSTYLWNSVMSGWIWWKINHVLSACSSHWLLMTFTKGSRPSAANCSVGTNRMADFYSQHFY
jgi:hypothetical protein